MTQLVSWFIAMAGVIAVSAVVTTDERVRDDCTLSGVPLYGNVQVVESFPDLRVKVVDSFPDLKVRIVESFPDQCGEWHMVESFPDFKIQYVESFPDLKIEFVESFAGLP